MKSIYILLTRSNTLVSNMVKLTTLDRYTHVSISFVDNLTPLYSFARRYTHSPLPAGLRHEYLTRGFFKRNRRIPCALYELIVDDETYENAKKIVDGMMEQADQYHFNLWGLLLCRLSIPSHRKHHYFCSEFVSKVLTESKALPLPKEPSLMRPSDYAKLPDLDCLFEGRLDGLIAHKQIS
ncbi:MAG: hypothetical protein E7616_01300 [Ruminococcaceae bacterium]|nr:hypothetical protein [Oscillospiraceae bacterium]